MGCTYAGDRLDRHLQREVWLQLQPRRPPVRIEGVDNFRNDSLKVEMKLGGREMQMYGSMASSDLGSREAAGAPSRYSRYSAFTVEITKWLKSVHHQLGSRP